MTHATKKQCTYFPCNKRLSLDRDFWQSSPHFLFTELLNNKISSRNGIFFKDSSEQVFCYFLDL